jgi:hypothetical protein
VWFSAKRLAKRNLMEALFTSIHFAKGLDAGLPGEGLQACDSHLLEL